MFAGFVHSVGNVSFKPIVTVLRQVYGWDASQTTGWDTTARQRRLARGVVPTASFFENTGYTSGFFQIQVGDLSSDSQLALLWLMIINLMWKCDPTRRQT